MNNGNIILRQANNMIDELIKLRRRFHMHPEFGFEEYETSVFIAEYLKELKLEVTTGVSKTGVVAVLEGELPGGTIALRADMDALPITEEGDWEYKSQIPGKMHACGHDAHVAILLGAAKLLALNKNKVKGNIKFIFQPAEEIISGAQGMIEEGVLKNPDVDLLLALHILPDIKSGSIGIREGIVMSSMDEFEINIFGKGGHGSTPQNTIDPIITGAHLVTAIQTIISRRINPNVPAVISICQFNAGTKSNIIPSTAYLSGTIRCQDETERKNILEQLNIVSMGICDSFGATCELKIKSKVPVVINDINVVNDFIQSASHILDKEKIEILNNPFMYSEDFALFSQIVPSLYFFLGTFNEKKNCIHPLHSSKFLIDEYVLPLGSALFANFCINRKL